MTARKSKSKIVRRPAKKKPQRRAATQRVARTPPVDDKNAALILAAIRRIPRGRVSTYGEVAHVAGLPRRARLVGTVLRTTSAPRDLPWFRVINAGGRISFPVGSDAHARQRKKLEAEGVLFIGGRVNLKKYGWPERELQLDELLWKLP